MENLKSKVDYYLTNCSYQKKLSEKTIKAYRIDLTQFEVFSEIYEKPFTKNCITQFILGLHQKYKPKTVKRKIASIRAFINFLAFDDQIDENPIGKMHLVFREPLILPKALPLRTIHKLLRTAYVSLYEKHSERQYKLKLRNIAVLELLFAAGLRVSELCSIKHPDIDLKNGFVKVYGKGARERIVFISNQEALSALRKYKNAFSRQIKDKGWFFINRLGNKLQEQSVRDTILSYAKTAKIAEHVTPHMIRHSFATLMLEEDVDIRYIQDILGHSSITTTQIYTHVSLGKQRSIMRKKHPRNKIPMRLELFNTGDNVRLSSEGEDSLQNK